MAGRTFDLADMRALAAAAEAGTLGRAALRLHVSQPALTRRLQALEVAAGVALLDRSPRGVALTPAGRQLYEHARPLLVAADEVQAVLVGLRHQEAPIRLAASHSAVEAFVGAALLDTSDGVRKLAVELVTANSLVVRRLVGEGRADLGVAAGRPDASPNPAIAEEVLAEDEIVCAAPNGHLWAQRRRISTREFLQTPMVVRDPASNARWTVDAVLRSRGLEMADPLEEAPTPAAAQRIAIAHNAPVLLSGHVLEPGMFVPVSIDGLRFPRHYFLVVPAGAGLTPQARPLVERLRRRPELNGRHTGCMRRAAELVPLSRHHHAALERALRLRRATSDTAAEAVARFLAFTEADGDEHFACEERVLGPYLNDAERARLLDEHRRLRQHAEALRDAQDGATAEAAHAAGALLDEHVRWEERELFPALEERLSAEELRTVGAELAAAHGDAA